LPVATVGGYVAVILIVVAVSILALTPLLNQLPAKSPTVFQNIPNIPFTGGSNPEGITTGPDGALWFTERGGNQIGRITPSGQVREFPLPNSYRGQRSSGDHSRTG
jgi:hypothetical protein